MKQSVFATIANDIKKDILEKKYATGGLLPSENTLCAKYDVTRTTVRRALALLYAGKPNHLHPRQRLRHKFSQPQPIFNAV